jgi:hypothetical protein
MVGLTLKAIKEYQIYGNTIKPGTIMTEIGSEGAEVPTCRFIDGDGTIYNFDPNEMLFSKKFKDSFRVLHQPTN